MKKQTLFLLATITMILFFAGCKDDPEEMPKTGITDAEIVEDIVEDGSGIFQGTYTISLLATIMAPGMPPVTLPVLEDTDSDQKAIFRFIIDSNDETKVNAVLTMPDVDILEGLAPGDPPPLADDTYTLKFNLLNFCEDQDGVVTYGIETSADYPRLQTKKLMGPDGNPVFFIFTEDVAFTTTDPGDESRGDFNGSITDALEIPKEMAALIIPMAAQVIPDGATVSIKFSISLIEMTYVPPIFLP